MVRFAIGLTLVVLTPLDGIGQPAKTPRLDAFEFALPDGAVARLGNTRLATPSFSGWITPARVLLRVRQEQAGNAGHARGL